MLPTCWDTFPTMSPPPIEAADKSRLQNMRRTLGGAWSPRGLAEQVERDWPGHATGEAIVLYWRVRLLTSGSACIGPVVTISSLISWFAGYRTVSATVILIGASIMGASLAVLHAFRLWGLFKIGGWSRRRGGPVRRSEQPLRFWTWAVASSIILAIYVAGAGFLFWTTVRALTYTPN